MKIETADKIIVDRLCSTDAIELYELHQSFRLSAAQILLAIERLDHLGIAQLSGRRVVRTPNFELSLVRWRHLIYNRPMPWKRPKARRTGHH